MVRIWQVLVLPGLMLMAPILALPAIASCTGGGMGTSGDVTTDTHTSSGVSGAVSGLGLEVFSNAATAACGSDLACTALKGLSCFAPNVPACTDLKTPSTSTPSTKALKEYLMSEAAKPDTGAALYSTVFNNIHCLTVGKGSCTSALPTTSSTSSSYTTDFATYAKVNKDCASVKVKPGTCTVTTPVGTVVKTWGAGDVVTPESCSNSSILAASGVSSALNKLFCKEIVDGYTPIASPAWVQDSDVGLISTIRGYLYGLTSCVDYLRNDSTGYGSKKYGSLATIRWPVTVYNDLWGCQIMFGATGTPAARLKSIEDDLNKFPFPVPAAGEVNDCSAVKDPDMVILCGAGIDPQSICVDNRCCDDGWKGLGCPAGASSDRSSCAAAGCSASVTVCCP